MQEFDDGPCCVINRKVISSDLQEVGHIVATSEESFIISRGSDNEYRIPKSRVERFRGNDVLVNFRLNDLLLVELASLA
ncbi:MAG: hypothetical protein DLM72_00985 [Candidatus Nitrosopolaris wilkensis]|nr:MAG: hypothetical protein DLM72_00985 [Candidatus Nitrosopolaris wilkensis]